jgi:hypothetical protein
MKRWFWYLPVVLLVLCEAVLFWNLLFPGYLLTLDMVFVPHMPMPHLALGGFWNAALYRWAMYVLGLLIPGWIVEKIMLIGLFTALPTLAYRFLFNDLK